MPAGQVHRAAAGIVQLDPVGKVAVLVLQTSGVGGHELADANLGTKGERPEGQQEEYPDDPRKERNTWMHDARIVTPSAAMCHRNLSWLGAMGAFAMECSIP